MAFITIKGATVNRSIPNYGFEAITTFIDRNGNERKERYTIWTKDHEPPMGQIVDISGILSTKVEEYTNQAGKLIRYAAVHVNNPKITVAENQAQDPILEDAPF